MMELRMYDGVKEKQRIRVRREGDKNTFTIKQKSKHAYDKEWEVEVSDFKMMKRMLKQLNLSKQYDLQKYREIYVSPDKHSTIVFDHFPGLSPYMEIESSSEMHLKETMRVLGVSEEPLFLYNDLYLEWYGIEKNFDNLTFKNAVKVLGPYITKNRHIFNRILSEQEKLFVQKN